MKSSDAKTFKKKLPRDRSIDKHFKQINMQIPCAQSLVSFKLDKTYRLLRTNQQSFLQGKFFELVKTQKHSREFNRFSRKIIARNLFQNFRFTDSLETRLSSREKRDEGW